MTMRITAPQAPKAALRGRLRAERASAKARRPNRSTRTDAERDALLDFLLEAVATLSEKE